MRSEVKRFDMIIQKLTSFQHAMQTEMQEKLKTAFQTVEAMPIEDFENYRLITADRLMDAEIKGNFERLESLLNEEKSSNSA